MAMSINRPVVGDPNAMLRMSSPGKKPIVALFKKVLISNEKYIIMHKEWGKQWRKYLGAKLNWW